MKRRRRGRTWALWRRDRVRDLIAAGVSADGAIKFAIAELQLRRQVSSAIGIRRAKDSELEFDDSNPTQIRFYIFGSLKNLTESQRKRLEEMKSINFAIL